MRKHLPQIISLIIIAVLAAACTGAETPAPTPTQQPPTPVPATPTALPATEVSTATEISVTETTAPTAVPPTEEVVPTPTPEPANVMETNTMNITIGDTLLTATLAGNSSVDALKAALAEGPLTIDMRDYGSMEKVGPLGMNLPRNDEQITTQAGDIILYQGNALVIYYAPNSWNFTKLGKIDNLTADELKAILGSGDVTVTLSLP